jgi:excisionase family DNA binding protein
MASGTPEQQGTPDPQQGKPDQIGLGAVQFLTVAEVAATMRVSKMTVYRLVHGGELPAARVGRSFRVPKRAVEDYLRSAYFDAG